MLREILARKLACPDTLGLCDAILDGGVGVLDGEYTPVAAGIPFLGFRLVPGARRLKRRNGVLFARRLARATRAWVRGEVVAGAIWDCYLGWEAHAAHGETTGLRAALLRGAAPPGSGATPWERLYHESA
ncbi:hypothetical protein [uncultured Thiodictyon sp.]|uniref:hypothetical protein n=1 Tax=uncultured Thiodictyon sp. TaxID=1846217 RepID=UPI0025DE7607|nr:hypothetical protein [uncultured Thiodictyon sp.]